MKKKRISKEPPLTGLVDWVRWYREKNPEASLKEAWNEWQDRKHPKQIEASSYRRLT
jgi:hypothetical protein